MADLAFPRVTQGRFDARLSDPGEDRYRSPSGEPFTVGSGSRRWQGGFVLSAGDAAETRTLLAWHSQLDADTTVTNVPFYREWNGDGAFPFGTTFQPTSIANSGSADNAVVFGFTLPSGKTSDDVTLAAGDFMTVQGVLMRAKSVAIAAGAVTAVMANAEDGDRLTATTANIAITEAVLSHVKLLNAPSVAMSDRDPDVADPVAYAWVAVDG